MSGDSVVFSLPGNRSVSVNIPAGTLPGSVFSCRVPSSSILEKIKPPAATAAGGSGAAQSISEESTTENKPEVDPASPVQKAAFESFAHDEPTSPLNLDADSKAVQDEQPPDEPEKSLANTNSKHQDISEELYSHQLLRVVFGGGPLGLDLGETVLSECSAFVLPFTPKEAVAVIGDEEQEKLEEPEGELPLSDGGGASSARAMAAFWASPTWDATSAQAFATASGRLTSGHRYDQPRNSRAVSSADASDEADNMDEMESSRRRLSMQEAETAARRLIDPWHTTVAVVAGVAPDSAAMGLGVEVGDVLLQVNDVVLGRDHHRAMLGETAGSVHHDVPISPQAAAGEGGGGEVVPVAPNGRKAYAGPVAQAIRCIQSDTTDGSLSMTFLKRRPHAQAAQSSSKITEPGEEAKTAIVSTPELIVSEISNNASVKYSKAPEKSTSRMLEMPLEHAIAHLVDYTLLPPRGADLVLDASGTASAANAAFDDDTTTMPSNNATAANAGKTTQSHEPGAPSDVMWGYGSSGAFECLPFLEPDCLAELAQSVAPVDVVACLGALLLEQRLCVVAEDVAQLTPVCEALRGLLAPLAWQHCYIPLLPTELLGYLEAPIPYLIGLDAAHLKDPMVASALAASGAVTLRLKPPGATGKESTKFMNLSEGHLSNSSSGEAAAELPLWTSAFQPPPDEPLLPVLPPTFRTQLVARLDLCMRELRVDLSPEFASTTTSLLQAAPSPVAALQALEERAANAIAANAAAAAAAASSEASASTLSPAPAATKKGWKMTASSAFTYGSSSSSSSSSKSGSNTSMSSYLSSSNTNKSNNATPQWLHPLSLKSGLDTCTMLDNAFKECPNDPPTKEGVAPSTSKALQEQQQVRVWRTCTEAAQAACLLAWAELLHGHASFLLPASAAPGKLGPDGVSEADECFHGFNRAGFLAHVRAHAQQSLAANHRGNRRRSKEVIFSPVSVPTPLKEPTNGAAEGSEGSEGHDDASSLSVLPTSAPGAGAGVEAAAHSAVEAARAKLTAGDISQEEFEAIEAASAALAVFQAEVSAEVAPETCPESPPSSPSAPKDGASREEVVSSALAFLEAFLSTQIFEAFIEVACDLILAQKGDPGSKLSLSPANTAATLFADICRGPAPPFQLTSVASLFGALPGANSYSGNTSREGKSHSDGNSSSDGSSHRPEVWAPVAAPLEACWFAYRTLPRLDRGKLRARALPLPRTQPVRPLRAYASHHSKFAMVPSTTTIEVATAVNEGEEASAADVQVSVGTFPDQTLPSPSSSSSSNSSSTPSSFYSMASSSLSSASMSKMYRTFGTSRQAAATSAESTETNNENDAPPVSGIEPAIASSEPALAETEPSAAAAGGTLRGSGRRQSQRDSESAWRASTDARSLADRSGSVASSLDGDEYDSSGNDDDDTDDAGVFAGGGQDEEAPDEPTALSSETPEKSSTFGSLRANPMQGLRSQSSWRSMKAMMSSSTAKGSKSDAAESSGDGSEDGSHREGNANTDGGSSSTSSGATKNPSSSLSSWTSLKSASALSYKASVAAAATTYSASVAAAAAASKASKEAYETYKAKPNAPPPSGEARPNPWSADTEEAADGSADAASTTTDESTSAPPLVQFPESTETAVETEAAPFPSPSSPSSRMFDADLLALSRNSSGGSSGKEPTARRRRKSSVDCTNIGSTMEGLSQQQGSLWQRSVLMLNQTSSRQGKAPEKEEVESVEFDHPLA
jgi:hypothetical protein